MAERPAPLVSFVVPCYKLAHLLPECVRSILAQTFTDFEVLIMDDASPDNTPEVAASFGDPRVRHVRNDPNLGALPNYNKGISLARGKYVWLISADDFLRRPDALARLVAVLEANPRVNYVFSAGMGFRDGRETELLKWAAYADHDCVVSGREFLQRLMSYNLVLAPATLARRECYEKLGNFPTRVVWAGVPLDLIWGGDWYLWCLFALHGDVGYIAEPLVCYREHELAVTTTVTREALTNCFRAELGVAWQIKRAAEQLGYADVVARCHLALADHYGHHLTGKPFRSAESRITLDEFEASLTANAADDAERRLVRAASFVNAGDRCFVKKEYRAAADFYRRALGQGADWRCRLKLAALQAGRPAIWLRRRLNKLD